jgi:hypothetical protein
MSARVRWAWTRTGEASDEGTLASDRAREDCGSVSSPKERDDCSLNKFALDGDRRSIVRRLTTER